MSFISSSTEISFLAIDSLDLSSMSYPAEIALYLANGQHYHAWVKPMSDRHFPALSVELRDRVNQYGKYPVQICHELNNLCLGVNLYCDSWGMTTSWLDNLFLAAGQTREISCTPIQALLEEEHLGNWNARRQFVADILHNEQPCAASYIHVMQAVVNLFYREQPTIIAQAPLSATTH